MMMMVVAMGRLMCGKVYFPPPNINKQGAAVTNTDKREINCGDRGAYHEREGEENDHLTNTETGRGGKERRTEEKG